MEAGTINKGLLRFKHCDSRFYPYLEKVLNRLPEDISVNGVLSDLSFEIISFDPEEAAGQCYSFPNQVRNLVILNKSALKDPEFQIIHTVAHEIAHKIIGEGESRLAEKEAEDLLIKWGFQKESEKVNYAKPLLEDGGYKIGYEWAHRQKDLSQFEEFYDEWNEGKLETDRWDELYNTANIMSILDEMEVLGPPCQTSEIPENSVTDLEGRCDYGIVHGIMKYLKEKREGVLKRFDKELTQNERDELFWIILGEVYQKCQRLYDNRIGPLSWEYSEKYSEIGVFCKAIEDIGDFLEERRQKGGTPH